jgi:hypothetical protein
MLMVTLPKLPDWVAEVVVGWFRKTGLSWKLTAGQWRLVQQEAVLVLSVMIRLVMGIGVVTITVIAIAVAIVVTVVVGLNAQKANKVCHLVGLILHRDQLGRTDA